MLRRIYNYPLHRDAYSYAALPGRILSIALVMGLFVCSGAAQASGSREKVVSISIGMHCGNSPRQLGGEDFRVYQDNIPVRVAAVAKTESPWDVIFLLEATKQTHSYLEELALRASKLLDQLGAQDRIAVVTFASKNEVQSKFGFGRVETIQALQKVAASIPTDREVHLAPAINEAISLFDGTKDQTPHRRRAIFIFTSNQPKYSAGGGSSSDSKTLKTLADADVVLNAVIFANQHAGLGSWPWMMPSSATFEKENAFQLSQATGGQVMAITVRSAIAKVSRLLTSLQNNTYALTFQPRGSSTVGDYYQLRVELSDELSRACPKAKINVRQGFYLADR